MLKLQEQNKNKALTLEELKEVASSIGISDVEWKEMMENADKLADEAQKHQYFKNYDLSFETAVQSVSINPYQLNAKIIASESALKVYETDKKDEFLDKAEYYAKEVLKQSRNEKRAYEVLSALNKYKKQEVGSKKKLVFIAAGIILFIGFIAAFFIMPKSSESKQDMDIKFQLIEAQENANAAWAQVENVLTRRDELIPQLTAVVDINNSQYKTIIDEIDILKAELKNADKQKSMIIQEEINVKLQELTALIASQDMSENIELIIVQIEGTYNRISVETKRYNEAVKEYNILVKKYSDMFPEFEEMPYYNQK